MTKIERLEKYLNNSFEISKDIPNAKPLDIRTTYYLVCDSEGYLEWTHLASYDVESIVLIYSVSESEEREDDVKSVNSLLKVELRNYISKLKNLLVVD